jgi:hypothetical protein
MAEYPLTPGTLPVNTAYPGNVQGLLDLISSYMTVITSDDLRTYIVSTTQPADDDADKVWFEIQSGGAPRAIRSYTDGRWEEYSPFTFGDMVLVDVNATIASPWGVGSTIYTVNGVSKLTPTTPVPPTGTKYKVYVGHYS